MRSPAELHEHFRANGRKVTPQRDLVVRLLQNNTSHPTAEALFSQARQELPMISLKTVYQVLNDLRELGEIQVLDDGGASRFDPNVDEHHHMVCVSCNAIFDVEIDDRAIRPSLVSLRHGEEAVRSFVVSAVEVTFRGTCGDCIASATPVVVHQHKVSHEVR